MYLAKPPMVMTSHLLCPHNLLKPDYWDFRVEYEVIIHISRIQKLLSLVL
jgi:hypothetical protein